MVKRGLEPAHPIAVTLAASLEAIDALAGAKRGSPRIMPDETKPAITDCASRDPVRPVTFQAVRHFSLLRPVRILDASRLRGSSPAAQLSAGRRRASKGGRTTIRRLTALGFGLRDRLGSQRPRSFSRSPQSQAMAAPLRKYRLDKPKFTGHWQCTGGILDTNQVIPRGATALLGRPHDRSRE